MPFPFRTRRTRIDLCLNAALQPLHRGYYFSDPIAALLTHLAPGSRIVDEGAFIDENAEVIRSDIGIEVKGDAGDVLTRLTRTLESDYLAPRGSYAILDDTHHDFGTAAGIAIRLTPALPIEGEYDGVPAHARFVRSLGRIHDVLGGTGAVQSWMLREARSSAYLYGGSAAGLAKIGVEVLSRDFPESKIWVDTIA